jgi:transcriptional regulator with XRE-family HTH domain
MNRMTGAQIRAARGFLDWTVRDLGKKAKVHFNTVHAIERGKSIAKPETLAAIRQAIEKAGVQFTSGNRAGVRLRGPRPRRSPRRTAH